MVRPADFVKVCGVTKSFGATPVLRGVDLRMDGFTAVLGASGSGKTTLLRIIAGLELPDQGTVEVAGAVGYVPQDAVLFPHLTVLGNVTFGIPRRDRQSDRIAALVELVGLRGLELRMPDQLSGGQQHRVALARALAIEPRLVLLDEPFAALDASLRSAVRADVLRIIRAAGTAAVLVTHDQDEALSMADTVAVLRDGVIVQHDTPDVLYHQPRDAALAAFVGDANLIPGSVHGGTATTALGPVPVSGVASGDALVLVRPEQVSLDVLSEGGPLETGLLETGLSETGLLETGLSETGLLESGVLGNVVDCEFFGHDAMLRVAADGSVFLVRVNGADARPVGTRVRLGVRGRCRAFSRSSG